MVTNFVFRVLKTSIKASPAIPWSIIRFLAIIWSLSFVVRVKPKQRRNAKSNVARYLIVTTIAHCGVMTARRIMPSKKLFKRNLVVAIFRYNFVILNIMYASQWNLVLFLVQDMPCFRDTVKEICFTPVSLERTCGHIWKTTCGEVSLLNEISCSSIVEKRLPCGHLTRVKCSDPTDQIFCTVRTEHLLGCRHSVPTQCGVPLEKRLKLTCTVEEMKILPCGHSCRFKCGSKEANKPLNSIFCR